VRIPGRLLKTPIRITPALGNTGDGDTYGTPVDVWADVDLRVSVATSPTGQALSTWSRARIRPTVTVAGRQPAVGDLVSVAGGTDRRVTEVSPIPGAGRAPAGLLLIAGQEGT